MIAHLSVRALRYGPSAHLAASADRTGDCLMHDANRREFLRLSALALGLTAQPPAIGKALAIPAHNRTRSIQDVEHIVILMQENRSFDHYFGALRGMRGFGDRFPIPLAS